MNNFELRMTTWKLISPVTANCDSRSVAQSCQAFQRAVSGSNHINLIKILIPPKASIYTFATEPIKLLDSNASFLN